MSEAEDAKAIPDHAHVVIMPLERKRPVETMSVFLVERGTPGLSIGRVERKMGQKVLIVDDADDLRFSIEIVLRMNGYETFSARNGKEALDQVVGSRISGKPLDLIITDIVMPEMSGIELMEKLDEWRIEASVLVITGFLNDEYRDRLEAFKQVNVLEKPFELETLVSKVRESMPGA